MKKLSTRISIGALGLLGTTGGAFAQDVAVAVPTDSVFILNSLLFLIGGFLVFWMAAGFASITTLSSHTYTHTRTHTRTRSCPLFRISTSIEKHGLV